MIIFFLLFGFVLLVMVTFTSNKQECNIYHNNDFDEIATIANDTKYPATCVFNTTGQLIDLVPGNSKESMLYIDKAIKTIN